MGAPTPPRTNRGPSTVSGQKAKNYHACDSGREPPRAIRRQACYTSTEFISAITFGLEDRGRVLNNVGVHRLN